MAEKLETRSELFSFVKQSISELTKFGFCIVDDSNKRKLILQLKDTQRNITYQFDFCNQMWRSKTSSNIWSHWTELINLR